MPSFIDHFSRIEDPRIERHKRHDLMDILVLVVCAVISGAEGWLAIQEFGYNKLDWLRRFVPLRHGVPSHDGIAYVMARLSPTQFTRCFCDWVASIKTELGDEVIAIDGKTVRGSQNRRHGRKPLHLVSAWATSSRLVLGQEATDEKSNEITAIPRLLELLELKGCIVMLDAMGCQRDIAAQIVEQGGEYVIGLKGNQDNLYEAVQDFFTTAHASDFQGVTHDYREETDKGHGRLETRKYWITPCLDTLPAPEQWRGLQSIGMVKRECIQDGKQTCETRYFIAAIAPDAQRFAHAVRGHWGIENGLHWCLDVTFREDESRLRTGAAPAIMASIRHLVLNLFQQEPSKGSIKQKRLRAAWSDEFRSKVLLA
ncbi:ISAs1 family transposase [Dyella sp. M7H15-1]|uniref:ISAs1 family transposase n=1 Tax=Dyella sp. M7H15-1 TaxID=2501295 RepID=UPI001004DE57|nr:ISAs1 family transposase [Dyella sp. M7H15-1]QAU23227.1 ISAs1 family transposase [Dyella sp. M7H15-1]QAU24820.1 ISAs1 family transposase [Dyella sp. M7H15-1]